MPDLLFKTEVYNVVGACMEVYNTIGYGFLEIVYKDAMEIEFGLKGMLFSREEEFQIIYKNKKINRFFFSDFVLFDNIIVEVKANPEGIQDQAIAQTINYLKASGHKVGLIINFGKRNLEYKRVVF